MPRRQRGVPLSVYTQPRRAIVGAGSEPKKSLKNASIVELFRPKTGGQGNSLPNRFSGRRGRVCRNSREAIPPYQAPHCAEK